MRHGAHAADLEQRRAQRHAHDGPAAVGHLDLAAGGTAHAAHDRHQQRQREQHQERGAQAVMQRLEPGDGHRVGRARHRLQPVPGAGLDEARRHLPPGHREARQCAHGKRHGEPQQHGLQAAIPPGEAQPVVQADAAVHPHHQQEERVLPGERRPDVAELVSVGVVGAGEAGRAAVVDDVGDEKERDGEAGQDLRRFPDGQPPRQSARDLVERQRDVDEEGGQQHARAQPRARDDFAPRLHALHRLQADQAQRVVEEMRGRKREEDEAGRQPQTLQNITACQNVHAACCSALPRLLPRRDDKTGYPPCTARLLGPRRECHKRPSPRTQDHRRWQQH